jgi:hypothetical protein
VSATTNGRQRRRWLGVALGVVILFGAPLWLPPAVALPTGAAWGLALAALLVVVWLVTSQVSALPSGDRRATVVSVAVGVALAIPVALAAVVVGVAAVLVAVVPGSGLVTEAWRVFAVDPGVWLLVLLATVPLTYAFRPVTPRGAARWSSRRGLPAALAPDAASEVRRLRSWRTVPTVLGVCIATGTGSAYNLAIAVLGTADAASQRLLDVATASAPAGLLPLGGYLVGVVLAEATRRRPAAADGPRVAGFVARRPAAYLTPLARALPLVVAALLLLVTILVAAIAGGVDALELAPATVALAVVALAAGVPATQWLVVRRPQHVR